MKYSGKLDRTAELLFTEDRKYRFSDKRIGEQKTLSLDITGQEVYADSRMQGAAAPGYGQRQPGSGAGIPSRPGRQGALAPDYERRLRYAESELEREGTSMQGSVTPDYEEMLRAAESEEDPEGWKYGIDGTEASPDDDTEPDADVESFLFHAADEDTETFNGTYETPDSVSFFDEDAEIQALRKKKNQKYAALLALITVCVVAAAVSFFYLFHQVQSGQRLTLLKDQEAAYDVMDQLDALKNISLDKEDEVHKAREAYNKLTDQQQQHVTNVNRLTRAEDLLKQLGQMKEEDEQRVAREDAAKEKAKKAAEEAEKRAKEEAAAAAAAAEQRLKTYVPVTPYTGYVATEKDPLTMRDKASDDGNVVQEIARGEQVSILGSNGENDAWSYIYYNGKNGFVKSRYLSADPPERETDNDNAGSIIWNWITSTVDDATDDDDDDEDVVPGTGSSSTGGGTGSGSGWSSTGSGSTGTSGTGTGGRGTNSSNTGTGNSSSSENEGNTESDASAGNSSGSSTQNQDDEEEGENNSNAESGNRSEEADRNRTAG